MKLTRLTGLLAVGCTLCSCATAPTMTWNMPGVSMDQWATDLEECGGFNTDNGPTKKVMDNTLQAQNAANASVTATHVGVGGAAASGAAAGLVAGIIQGRQRRAALAERDECFMSRGYIHVMITPAQGKAALKMSLEERRALVYRLATAADATAIAP